MRAIEISKMNVANFNYIVGKSAGSKGTEILDKGSFVDSYYASNDNDGGSEYIDKFKAELLKHDLNTLIVDSISFSQDNCFSLGDSDYRMHEISLKRYDIKHLIANSFEGVRNVNIHKRSTRVGYLALSKYTKDIYSQKELLSDLVSLTGEEMYGEVEDNDCEATDATQEFSYRNDSYTSDDYTLEHGSSYTVEKTDDCLYVDGRCSPHNNDVSDEFWQNGFDESGWFKEIDPDETIAVYHRKGKDFYIGYTLEIQEKELFSRDENSEYESGDYDSEVFYYMTYTPDKEKLDKVKSAVESLKEDFEHRSYIYNEMQLDSYNSSYSGQWSYNDDVFDLTLFDLIFNDRREALNYVQENIYSDDTKTMQEICRDVNNKLISQHVVFNVDRSIEVENIQYFSDRPALKTKYNQLKVLKRLENKLSFELVWSVVGNTESFAIKQDDEEYHFNLGEILDEDTNLIEFLQTCLRAISKRKIEKLSELELLEKASHVFVGINDSFAVGNCEFGTNEFISRNNINTQSIGGIRGDALLEIESSSFTKRMVMFKIAQASQMQGASHV